MHDQKPCPPTRPPEPATSRRQFLKGSAFGAAALLSQLRGAQEVFAEALPSLPSGTETSFAGLRQAYGLDPRVTYLNHASIGTIPLAVQATHRRYLELCESNPWLHMWGEAWQEPREEARRLSATVMGAEPEGVAITHNTTEAFNLLAQGWPLGPGDEVLFSSLNHSGASLCWDHAAEARGFTVRRFDFPVADVPGLSPADVARLHAEAISDRTRVLVLPHVDNVVGLRHPLAEISRLARARGVELIAVDAAQTVGMLPLDVAALGVDIYATSAHKWLQAPKGLGLLWVSVEAREKLRPFWVTWGQRRWAESARKFEDYGTRNLPEVLTLGDAIRFRQRLDAGKETGQSITTASERHHRRLWRHARARTEASSRLTWCSPTNWDQSAALYSVGVQGEEASSVFQRLFAEHGLVFRPFETLGLNSIRLSPNTLNTTADLDRVFDLLGG